MSYYKFGFHCTATGNLNGIGDYIKAQRAAERPVILQSTDSAGVIYEACTSGEHPQDALIFRRTGGTDLFSHTTLDRLPEENATYSGDAVEVARHRWQYLIDNLPPELRPFLHRIGIVTINEPSKERQNYDYLGKYAVTQGQLAIDQNAKVFAFGWSGGTPEREFWENTHVLEYLQMCADYPEHCGISLHEYSFDENRLDKNAPFLIGRFQVLHDVCDEHGIAHPQIHIGEFGWGEHSMSAGASEAMRQLSEIQKVYAPHSNIIGACIWTLGNWSGSIVDDILPLVPLVSAEAVAYDYTPPEPPPPEEKSIFDISQAWAFPVNEVAALQKVALSDGFTPSGEERWIVVDGIQTAMQPFYKIGDTNNKRSYYAAIPNWNNVKWTDGSDESDVILNIPHMLQFGIGADARRNDCGAASAAMCINGLTDFIPTVDDIAIQYQSPANSYMSFAQIINALRGYKLSTTYKRPFTPSMIKDSIISGEPVIALVWYPSLPFSFSSFVGSHFIVIYGVSSSGNLYYHDPLGKKNTPLLINTSVLKKAMSDVVDEGNQPQQALSVYKTEPVPPTRISTAPYFAPLSGNENGRYVVMHFDSGKTQPQQLRWIGNKSILFKGEGQWIDGKMYQDYEEYSIDGSGIHKHTDTSDAGHGGLDAYDLGGAVWLPSLVAVGAVYKSSPTVKRFNRSTCEVYSEERTDDYLYIREIIPHWTSPKNSAIKFKDVLVVEWRKTRDLNTPAIEVYKFAKGVGYVEWNGGGRDGGAVGELPGGREPLGGELSSC